MTSHLNLPDASSHADRLLEHARASNDHQEVLRLIDARIAQNGRFPALLLDRATALMALDRLSEAEAACQAALARDPNYGRAFVTLYRISRRQGLTMKALSWLQDAMDAFPDDKALQDENSTLLQEMGRGPKPRPLPTSQPEPTPNIHALFEAARARRDHAQALAHLMELERTGATGPALLMDMAETLAVLDRLPEAAAACHAALALNPEFGRSYVALYQIARREQDTQAALEFVAKAVAAIPEDPGLKLDQAELLIQANRKDEAVQLLEQLLNTHPKPADISLRLGHLARSRDDRPAALAHYRRATDINPQHSEAKLELAAELAHAGQFDEAATLTAALRSPEPVRAETWLRLGHIARLLHNRPQALADFRKARDLAPANDDIRLWLATECREQGLLDDAATLLVQPQEGAPSSLREQLEHGHLARARGDLSQAHAAYTAAREAFPEQADTWLWLSRAELALGLPQADETLRQALALDPNHVEAMLHQAGLALEVNDTGQALALCRRVRSRVPSIAAAWQIESRALMNSEGVEPALALIDAAEAQIGRHPELLARRTELLQQAGLYPALRTLLQDKADQIARHPEPFNIAVLSLLRLGEQAQAAALLTNPPGSTASHRAMAEYLRGITAETRWDQRMAQRHYETALTIDPGLDWIFQDIARVAVAQLDTDTAQAAMKRYITLTSGHRRLRGEQARATSTWVGQMINEYRLGTELLATLKAALALPIEHHIPALRTIAADEPESTAVAMTLMLAMRAAGLFSVATPQETPNIPKRITQFWAQGAPPPDVAALTRSWPETNPGYRHQLLNDAAAQDWLIAHARPDVIRAYNRSTQFAQKSDLLRLAILSVEGGWYLDADDRCVGPLSPLTPDGIGLVLYQEDFGTFGNNMIGCTPGHPVIVRALAMAVAAVQAGDSEALWFSTGPGLLTRAMACDFVESGLEASAWLAGKRLLDRASVSRSLAMHCHTLYKSTDDHWMRRLARRSGVVSPATRSSQAMFRLSGIRWTQR